MKTRNNIGAFENHSIKKYCEGLRSNFHLNKKILFVQTPQVVLDSFNRDIALAKGYYIFPPTGIQYLCEAITHRGFEIRILDLNFEILKKVHKDPNFNPNDWVKIFEKILDEFEPSVLGVSCLFDVGIMPMLDIIRIARKKGKSIIIGGGAIATYEWKNLLSDELCQFVVEGEGENKLNYLLDVIYGEKNTPPTPGIHFLLNNEYKETSGPDDIVDIKGDLTETYKLIKLPEYCEYGSLNPFSRAVLGDKNPFAAIQLGRGCRAACTFCSVRDFIGKGVRFRNLDDILCEMTYLKDKLGVRHFELLDDDPTFYKDKFKELCKEIIKRKWDIRWSASNGIIAASVDYEMMGLMRDSGCIGFAIGIESGNKEMLKRIKKPGSHTCFLEFGKMLDDFSENFVKANYILGLPEETFGQMLDTFWFSLEDNMDWAAFTVCQIIRGASAFADSGEYFESQMKTDGQGISNFIPTRYSNVGELDKLDKIKRGMDVFLIDEQIVPTEAQIKEIWFTFNFIVNYAFNKNLSIKGTPAKFINWMERVRLAYPTNPNMNIFLAYAYILDNNKTLAQKRFHDAVSNLEASEYWKERIDSFELYTLYDSLPMSGNNVHKRIDDLKKRLIGIAVRHSRMSGWKSTYSPDLTPDLS